MRRYASLLASGSLAAAALAAPSPAAAQGGAESFLGSIYWTGANFCPRGTAEAAGQILQISSNSALFSLLGTTYGGDGRSTFALPDLRGRAPIGEGQGPGLSNRLLGEVAGAETATLTIALAPSHTHAGTTNFVMRASSANGTSSDPTGRVLANGRTARVYSVNPSNVDLDAASIAATASVNAAGSGVPFQTIGPSLVMKACITTQGIFPSRP